MKTFCTNCGGGITYDSVRPNFCPDCGNPLGGAKASTPGRPPIKRPVYEEEYEEDLHVAPGELNVSLINRKAKPVMGESVFGTGATGFGTRRPMRPEDIEAFNRKLREEKTAPIEIDGGS